jgi:uncharacterized protein YdcH (DUF465 family)
MTNAIDPEFYRLFDRSKELLAVLKAKREAGSVDWNEISQIHDEISQMGDEMTTMLPEVNGG